MDDYYREMQMKIYLMRHGKVDFKWESFYTSEAFDRACAEYDQIIRPTDTLQWPE